MAQKIGIFLTAILVLWSLLLLSATELRGDAHRAQETSGSPAVQTTAPQTAPETTPQSPPETAPEAVPPQTAAPVSAGRVARALEGRELAATAVSHRVYVPELNAGEETQGTAADSCGAELAELAAERKMNPIAAFWALVSEGLYQKAEAGALTPGDIQVPEQSAAVYPYTAEGARQLLTDLLNLASRMEDGLALAAALLGTDMTVEAEQVFWSEADNCRYAYFIGGGERSTHILCFYLRGGETITDVELQILNLTSAQGNAQALEALDRRGDAQAAALMAAAELLLTGRSRAGEGQIPSAYEIGTYQAAVERFRFTGDKEWGTMPNYRIKAT